MSSSPYDYSGEGGGSNHCDATILSWYVFLILLVIYSKDKAMKKKSRKLVLSVTLNLLFLSGGVLLLPKRGVTSYLFSNQQLNQSPSQSSVPVKFSSYYLDRKSLFDILPHNRDEIIFLGDSLTNRCEWSELLENQNVKNRGINGDNIYAVLKRLDQITASRPKKIFIMIGINDIIANESFDKIIYKYKLMLTTIKQASPDTKVFVQSVLPVNNSFKWTLSNNNAILNNNIIIVNKELKILATQFQYEYIDLHSLLSANNELIERFTNDGLHLNGEGYYVWKQAIMQYLD